MEGLNRTAVDIPRKLLEGEHVEVRQKEVGLRGSWHSGVVVKVKYSRRVVEYDDLFTLDGSKKLRESIPLFEDVKLPDSALREKNGTVAKPNKRGFIRPRPPPYLVNSSQNWKRGLLVDAFYDDAWWEGILLDDVFFGYDEAKVKVFFPEEGDELRIFVKDIRVSQEWDEASGQWAMRGSWSFNSRNGRIDLGPLKQMCMKPRSSLKALWRQRRFCGSQDLMVKEQRTSCPSSTPVLHNQLDMSVRSSQNVVQEKTPLPHNDTSTVLSNGVTTILSEFQQPLVRILKISSHPVSAQAHTFLEEGQLVEKEFDQSTSVTTEVKSRCDFLAPAVASGAAKKVSSDPEFNLTAYKSECSREEADALAALLKTPLLGANMSRTLGEGFPGQSLIQKSKRRESDANSTLQDRITGKGRASSRITRSTFSMEMKRNDECSLSRSSELPGGDLQQATECEKLLDEGKVLPTSLDGKLPKLDLRRMILDTSVIERDRSDGKQIDTGSGGLCFGTMIDPLSSERRPFHQGSLGVWENHSRAVQDNDSRDNGAVSPECPLPPKIRMRQARLAAKRFLLDAGWKIDARTRSRGLTLKQEAVYVSPNGSRFFSLAAACRGWKTRKNVPNSLGEGLNKEIKLLNAYNMAEGFRCFHKPYTRQAKAEHMMLSDGSAKATSDAASLSMGEDRDPDIFSNSAGIPEDGTAGTLQQKNVELPTSPNMVINDYVQEKVRLKNRNKLIPMVEKSKKRKSDGHGGLLPAEPRRKRGRPSLKKRTTSPLQENKGYHVRGGCRMQVLLSFPEREKDSNSSQDIGEPSHFKKSTVLSWLIDKAILKENESVCYVNRKDGHVMKKGQVTREGVICDCCKDVFTLSNFEAHAGSKLHRPSANIFLDDGRSISDCQLEACALQDAKEKKEGLMDISDDSCGVCGDGGELVLCDHCPSTFHADCIGLEIIPEGDWYCPRCSCGLCGCNQLACDADNTMLRCMQCELEYHLTCVPAHVMGTLYPAAQKIWFCDRQCAKIFKGLRGLVGIANSMENGFSWMLLRSMKKDQGLSPSSLEVMAEHHSKLSVAHGVMQECFVPMIDPRTKINLISQALYNRRSKVARLNYCGFYTILLERGDEIISVATIRVHGARLAEMPLVGTRYQYRRQGMCRRLMQALEEMLKNIGVEKLILPAVPELLETWIGAFKFQHMSLLETQELSKLSLMTFPGTTLLQKHLLAASSVSKPIGQPLISDGIDNLESPSCKSVEEFFSMARASLDSGVLECGQACLTGGTMENDILLMDSSGQSLCAIADTLNHAQEAMPDDPQTPMTALATGGNLDVSSKGGRSKNRTRCKAEIESSGDALVAAKEREDEDIYTRVVIATTRSKRLVKSTRWVADGLKELKDAKQSKRTLSTEGNLHKIPLSESVQELKCGHLIEKSAQNDDDQDNGQIIENVYIRTRRKVAPMSLEPCEVNETQEVLGFSAREYMNDSMVEFHRSEYGKQYNHAMGIIDTSLKLSCPSAENLSCMSIRDEGVKANSCLRDGLNGNNSDSSKDGQSSKGEARDELLICPKYYTRRKKKDSGQEDSKIDIAANRSDGQTVGPFSQDQTLSASVSDIKQGGGTIFTSSVDPGLVLGAVDGQGCKSDSCLEK